MMRTERPLKERPLRDLLDGLLVAHRQDIRAFSGGHLNESKLPKAKPPTRSSQITWKSAHKPHINMLARSLPPKSKHGTQRDLQMTDTMMHFSLGTSNRPGKNTQTKKKTPVQVSKHPVSVVRMDSTASQGSYSKCDDGILVEEIQLPQTVLPKAFAEEDLKQEKPPSQTLPRDGNLAAGKQQLAPSHMQAVTKRDQFCRLKEYETEVLRKQDSTEQNVLTGMKAVEHLELKLHQDLTELSHSGLLGPSFHTLQVYSNTFEELIRDSVTFGYILRTIKKEYDEYVSLLLDTQPAKHQVLYEQVEKLSARGTSNPRRLRKETDRVQALEKEAKKLLNKNDRLRKELAVEQQNTATQPVTEPQLTSTVYEHQHAPELTNQIEDLHTAIMSKLDELTELRTRLRKEFVPSTVCTHLEQCIKETEVEIQKLTTQKEFFERNIADMEKDLQEAIAEADTTERDARRVWKRIAAVKSTTEKIHRGPGYVAQGSDDEDESDSEGKWSWYIS